MQRSFTELMRRHILQLIVGKSGLSLIFCHALQEYRDFMHEIGKLGYSLSFWFGAVLPILLFKA